MWSQLTGCEISPKMKSSKNFPCFSTFFFGDFDFGDISQTYSIAFLSSFLKLFNQFPIFRHLHWYLILQNAKYFLLFLYLHCELRMTKIPFLILEEYFTSQNRANFGLVCEIFVILEDYSQSTSEITFSLLRYYSQQR